MNVRAKQLQNLAMQLGNGIFSLGSNLPVFREAARNQYTPRSTHYAMPAIGRAAAQHLDDIKPGAKMPHIDIIPNIPEGKTFNDRLNNVMESGGLRQAASSFVDDPKGPFININPTAGREIFAHEVSHLISHQTDVGRIAAQLRANPKLTAALGTSLMVLPGAAVFEGGDDDLDSSLALAAASQLPIMIDEGLATKHGLAMMEKAGMRATLGQRGKLAAGLLSYLAPAMVLGAGANMVGNAPEKIMNMFNDETIKE